MMMRHNDRSSHARLVAVSAAAILTCALALAAATSDGLPRVGERAESLRAEPASIVAPSAAPPSAPPAAQPASSTTAGAIANVQTGAIRGSVAANGQAIFKGIPFARPPVGDFRWREPQPPESWTGVRDATAASPACMQNPLGTGVFITQLAARYGVSYDAPRWTLSEDCLYLNVYTPEWPTTPMTPTMPMKPVKTPAAVMVWLHGGSNVTGAGSEYHAARLASRGVIIVTTNYRLGALGFFAHPELTRESPHGASGNYGLLDQIAALQWVRRNIAAFGGDPSNVTVFGESAGAIDAGVLMASPLATGLFQRVIVQSGPVLGLVYPPTREKGEQFGQRVATAAHATSLAALRALPPDAIFAAAKAAAAVEPDPGIILDGHLLPRAPAEVFARREQQPVALLIGNNARELSVYRSPTPGPGGGGGAGPIKDMSGPKKTLRIFYGRMGTIAIGMYALEARIGSTARADGWLNDVLATCPSAAMAALNAAAGRPAYVYQFRRTIAGKGESDLGAFHSLDLPFVFESFQEPVWRWLPFTPTDVALSDRMQRYWTNFAKTGNPNGSGLPEWRGFNPATEDYLAFASDGRAVPSQGVRPTFCTLDVSTLSQRLLDNP